MSRRCTEVVGGVLALAVLAGAVGCSRERPVGKDSGLASGESARVEAPLSITTAPPARTSVSGEVFTVETLAEFAREALSNTLPVLVMFHSRTSAPCVMMLPALHRMAREYAGRVCVMEVDVGKPALRALEAQYTVLSVPTFLFLRGGREQHRLVGTTKPDRLAFMIETKLLAPGTIPRYRK